MAVPFVKALNAKTRANPTLSYFCSTHFVGPASNFGIPIAADSGTMTGALFVYAGTFMRYSLAITPKNYLLFACHAVNAGAQGAQGYRWLQWHYWGGKERMEATNPVGLAKDKLVAAGGAGLRKT
ncbi:UPF0041-domain-containing protein [Cadophora sp. DSE1049]|nr:UPF0041-domain-containing protein [Cadophora sp. DSE1049]